MKTIRWKIVTLFAGVTVVTILLVLLLFNIAISVYFDKSTRAELKNTFAAMDILIEKRLTDSLLTGDGNAGDAALSDLGAALTASHLSGSTEFYIFDESFNVLFPTDPSKTVLDDSLLNYIRTLNFGSEPSAIYKAPQKSLYVAGMQFDKLEGVNLYIVFLASAAASRHLTLVINILLAAVMLISAVVGVFLARAAADRISKPINKACGYAAEIGSGNFIEVPPDESFAEIARMCRSISDMSDRLKAAEQAHKQFLQNASHELKTPLMSIQGYAEAIETGIGYRPEEAAAVIKAESIRLTALVGELLTLSRMESSVGGFQLESIELGELIGEYIYKLNGAAFRERKTLVWTPAEKEVTVWANEQLLSQVVVNLVSNCLRYAENEVRLTRGFDGSGALLTICDDGPGISPEDLPHIFDRFYKGKNGNFGLGLAIAKKAADLMGGSISAQNRETGAVFCVRFKASV